MKKKILNILPLTENFSIKYSGAASIFILDNLNYSKHEHWVVGSTYFNDQPSKNYINIDIKKNLFKSSNNEYFKKISNYLKKNKYDYLEVHNRPELALNFKKKNKNQKIFLYFHNDPTQIRGSKSDSERLELLNKIDKIFFVSEWVRLKFFINLNFRNTDKAHIIYPTIKKPRIDINKKKKNILFIGKLNSSKGYHLFKNSIKQILNKHPDWKAFTIGSEPRENIKVNHENLIHLGWLSYKETLKYIAKSSIVITPSVWEEPFGRVANEASLYGNVTITSNKGGLPETNEYCINLKEINETKIIQTVNKLINNKKLFIETQKLSKNGFKFDIIKNIKYLDRIRDYLDIKLININLKRPLKIIHITDQHIRHKGRLYYSTGKKLTNGFIRNDNNTLVISDRDLSSKTVFTRKHINNYILDTCSNFRPDIIVFGHADRVGGNDLMITIKDHFKGVKFCQWFLDPLIPNGPDFIKNKKRVLEKSEIMDVNFLTTNPKSLNFKIKNAFFIPNPVDKVIDNKNFYKKNNQVFDLFFALSHGQHRGVLKPNVYDERSEFLKLFNNNDNLKINLFGLDKQPVWGDEFFYQLGLCKMALNLSRGKAKKYYSSDRLATLMGNGILTFINKNYMYGNFFNKNEIVEYSNFDDLNNKINFYKKNSKIRKRIAYNGMKKYHKIFSSDLVCEYIIHKTLGKKLRNPLIWMK